MKWAGAEGVGAAPGEAGEEEEEDVEEVAASVRGMIARSSRSPTENKSNTTRLSSSHPKYMQR